MLEKREFKLSQMLACVNNRRLPTHLRSQVQNAGTDNAIKMI